MADVDKGQVKLILTKLFQNDLGFVKSANLAGEMLSRIWSFSQGDNNVQRAICVLLYAATRLGISAIPPFFSDESEAAVYLWCHQKVVEKRKWWFFSVSDTRADTRVFGSDDELDGKSRFSKSDPSWDGHAWIALGDYVADVSLFRTARSGKSLPALASHVATEFGPKAGLMICEERDVEKSGLRYEARYVLTQDQVDGLARGALQMIQNK